MPHLVDHAARQQVKCILFPILKSTAICNLGKETVLRSTLQETQVWRSAHEHKFDFTIGPTICSTVVLFFATSRLPAQFPLPRYALHWRHH